MKVSTFFPLLCFILFFSTAAAQTQIHWRPVSATLYNVRFKMPVYEFNHQSSHPNAVWKANFPNGGSVTVEVRDAKVATNNLMMLSAFHAKARAFGRIETDVKGQLPENFTALFDDIEAFLIEHHLIGRGLLITAKNRRGRFNIEIYTKSDADPGHLTELMKDVLFSFDTNSGSKLYPFMSKRLKYGYKPIQGRVVVRPTYKGADYFYGGFAIVEKDFLYGWINREGKEIVEPKFGQVMPFYEGYSAVTIRKPGEFRQWRFVDTAGNFIGDETYYEITRLADAFYMVAKRIDGKLVYGLKSPKLETLLPTEYDFLGPFSGRLMIVAKEGKYGFVDYDFKPVIPLQYEKVKPFSQGLAAVKMNSLWGFISTEGELVIPCQFGEVEPFESDLGYARVMKGGFGGAINKRGETVVDPKFNQLYRFRRGVTYDVWMGDYIMANRVTIEEFSALARLGSRWVIIDQTGSVLHETSTEIKIVR